jgi:CO dehydrogenase/acetyl-CoA synthase delta subunit
MPNSTSIPLHLPRPARVRTATDRASGAPVEVDGRQVAQVRESWLVEDRWWTERPLRRRYWEVVTGCGRNIVVFRDLEPAGGWFVQR